MKEIIYTIYDVTLAYYGSAVFLLLAVMAGVFLMLTDWKRYGRIIIPTLIIIFIIINPLAYKMVLHKSRFWRLYWMIPGTLIIVMAFGELLRKCNKSWKKLIVTFAMLLIISLSGTSVFSGGGSGKNTNIYRLPESTVGVGKLMMSYEKKPKCIVNGVLLTSIRQYNGDIMPMYGRDSDGYVSRLTGVAEKVFRQMNRENPDYSFVLMHARRLGYSFVVNVESRPIQDDIAAKYGYSLLDTIDGYNVYYNDSLEMDKKYIWKENKKGCFVLDKNDHKIKQKCLEIAGVWYYFNRKGYLIDSVDSDMAKELDGTQLIVTQLGDDDYPGPSMSYTIDDQKGHFIIVDGGNEDEYKTLMAQIKKYGNKVDAWILTHPHSDHIGAFNKIYEDYVLNPEKDSDKVSIDKIYAIDIDSDYYHEVAKPWDGIECYDKFCELTKGADNVTYVKDGETYKAGDFDFKVYNTFTDDSYEIKTGSLPNVVSMVFEIFGQKESMLFLADLEQNGVKGLKKKHGDELSADYVQAAHHGQNVKTSFYDELDFNTVFVDAPAWLRTENPDTHTAYEHLEYFKERNLNIYTFETTPNTIIVR